MKEGEELVELKIHITKESCNKFFEKIKTRSNSSAIFDLLNKHFDVRNLSMHDATVMRTSPTLYVETSCSGLITCDKKWSEEEN